MSPKITVHGGVSNAFEQGPPGFVGGWSDEDTPNVWPAPATAEPPFVGACPVCQASTTGVASSVAAVEGEPVADWKTFSAGDMTIRYEPCGHEVVKEGGEQSSPGNSSSPSAEKPPTSDEPKKPSNPPRARSTGNRSKKPKGNSTAGSADA